MVTESYRGQRCPLKDTACQEECARCEIYRSGYYNLTLRNRPHPGIFVAHSADLTLLKDEALRQISLFFVSVPVKILGELAQGARLEVANSDYKEVI